MLRLIKSTYYHEEDTTEKLIGFLRTNNMMSFGQYCQEFEQKFSVWQGRKYTTFVNSGSSANLALIQSLLNLGRLKKGSRVGFSALTWSTNVMPLIQLGLDAIPVDVASSTLNVSLENVMSAHTDHGLDALFITNLLGLCHDLSSIAQYCKENNILLIEDNCESMGSVHDGRKLGNFGLASTFSFYVGHHMSTIEGGAVCTNDKELSRMLTVVRAHGWDRNLMPMDQEDIRNEFKINERFYSRYTFYDLGYNLRPTEINGFLGCNQLQYADEITRKRAENFERLSVIYNNPDIRPLETDQMDIFSNFAVPLVFNSKEIRNEYVNRCEGKVEVRPIVGGDMTQQPFWKKYSPHFLKDSNAKMIHDCGIYFGNNPELTDQEINELVEVFT
jgi:CDP-6-deoxy-D-xylo-4-hexulose-3-dehydrase